MGVLDERTGIAVEVDGFLGIEEHGLLGVHLDDEIFQGSQTERAEELVLLLSAHVGQLAELQRGLFCCVVHLLQQIVRIHDSPLAGLHLTLRQLHHTVGQVIDMVRPREAQLLEYQLEYLEMVVLLVAHHIDMLVQIVLGKSLHGRTQILGDIH